MTTRGGVDQSETDIRNAAFWNELCGSGLARSVGITDRTPESLRKFDEAYMAMYPYLSRYVTAENLTGKRTLEIGLGYGTLGQLIALRGCQYHGLDIAAGPVEMMRYDSRSSARRPRSGFRKVQLSISLTRMAPSTTSTRLVAFTILGTWRKRFLKSTGCWRPAVRRW